MKWAAAIIYILLACAATAKKDNPGLIILCKIGVVSGQDFMGEIASGTECVLHDKHGARTTYSISIYDNGDAAQ